MDEFEFLTPTTLGEACQMLMQAGSHPVAGCTDVLPQMRRGRLKAKRLVDLSQLGELKYVEHQNGWIHLGALLTYQELIEQTSLQSSAPALIQAAASIGCLQTRNRGTLGGNLGNASPAGDCLPPLLVMNAEVRLIGPYDERKLPLSDFLLGPGKTALQPGEIIRQVDLEPLPASAETVFLKLGHRQGMAVSVVSAALTIEMDGSGVVKQARIALGAVAPSAMRCPKTEALLVGQAIDELVMAQAGWIAAQECNPIDDVRGSAVYRRHAVQVLVKRGLQACLRGRTR
jgi:carbon-monoxide dehydrogenase medium subunit